MTTKTYKVTTYEDKATYSITIDDSGVVDADGLSGLALGNLKTTVRRYMTRHGLPVETALGLAVGPYSHVTLADKMSVSDQAQTPEVS